MASSSAAGPTCVMGFNGGNHRGQGTMPLNFDAHGNATTPLSRLTRKAIERGHSKKRKRSRDRSPSGPHTPGDYGFNTAGPQEAMDWSHALQNVVDRVETLERNQRTQAESMARVMAQQDQIGERLGILSSTMSQLRDTDKGGC